MSTKLVTTPPGRLVKDPRGKPVPEKFTVDPHDPFWAALLNAGDLVSVEAATPAVTAIAIPAFAAVVETKPVAKGAAS